MNEEQLEAALRHQAEELTCLLFKRATSDAYGARRIRDEDILTTVQKLYELCESYLYVHKELSQ